MEDLPRPIPPHDMHVHTVFSDGCATVREIVQVATAVGLDSVAITDHAGPDSKDLRDRLTAIEQVARDSEIAVLAGIELSIRDAEGHLALPPGDVEQFHLVLATFDHATRSIATDIPANRSRLVENVFSAYRAVVESGHVNVIANPFNLGRFPAPLAPDDLPRAYLRDLARLMAARGVMFELNASAAWWHPDLSFDEFVLQWKPLLQVFAREDVRFVAGTGAHEPAAVGNNHFTRRMMRLAGIELSQVVNLRALVIRKR